MLITVFQIIVKRYFIVGPPGSQRKRLSLDLEDFLKKTHNGAVGQTISVGDLIHKEYRKKSEFARDLEESLGNYSYVKDEIVIELVMNQIELLERENKSYIVEGFPKTEI